MPKSIGTYLVLTFSLSLLFACSRTTYEKLYPTLSDGKYDTEFPYRDCSEQLEMIAGSVFKIYCMVDYKSYILDPSDRLLPEDITTERLFSSTNETIKTSQVNTGTGTLVFYDNTHIAFLTCAHIFNFPDTLYTYFNDNDPYSTDYLQGISVITRKLIFVRGYPECNDMKVLARDLDKDLAFVGRTTDGNHSDLTVFPFPLGRSESLEWGSFTYILGYPMGYQMITRGVVSKPQHQSDDMFLIDANFNEGFSGSVVLAIRDGIPNFELVGIGKSASATFENVLVPEDPQNSMTFNPNIPYEGDIYVRRSTQLNYGVTFAVSTKAIREFYADHKSTLHKLGFLMDGYFE